LTTGIKYSTILVSVYISNTVQSVANSSLLYSPPGSPIIHVPEKNEKIAGVRGVSPVGGKVKEQWRKGFVEKMSFEPGVEERRSNGW